LRRFVGSENVTQTSKALELMVVRRFQSPTGQSFARLRHILRANKAAQGSEAGFGLRGWDLDAGLELRRLCRLPCCSRGSEGEKTSLELMVVRRFQSPTGQSFARLRHILRANKAPAGVISAVASGNKCWINGR
jgi:hypothetical protein